MDQFAHFFLGSRLGCGPRHMPCRDHSNHDRRKIVGKRVALDPTWEVHDGLLPFGVKPRDSVTTQVTIGKK